MTAIWKPTSEQCKLIKRAAALEAKIPLGAVLLEPGERFNEHDNAKNIAAESIPYGDLNIALISDDAEWNDTDLLDYGLWASFRAGVALTPDGRAIVDFYIRKRFDPHSDLNGNITVRYEGGRITQIKGYPDEYPVA